MDARRFFLVEPMSPGPIDELSDVLVTESVTTDSSRLMPKGSRGTVVAVHGLGEAYSVEFSDPFHALLLLKADQLDVIPEATREHLIANADTVRHRSSQD